MRLATSVKYIQFEYFKLARKAPPKEIFVKTVCMLGFVTVFDGCMGQFIDFGLRLIKCSSKIRRIQKITTTLDETLY